MDDIVGNPISRFSEIYECRDCHSLWWIKTRGSGDPRSTYPEFYEQTAERIDDQRSELIRNPTIAGIITHKDSKLPYSFFEEILEIVVLSEKEKLKELYLKREENVHTSVKLWLRRWFPKEYPKEFEEIQKKGFPTDSKELLRLEETESVLVSEFISRDQFVFLTKNTKEDWKLQTYDLTKKEILWSKNVQRPFLEGLKIPILFYQSGYLCYYQGFQKGSEYYSQLNRPETLRIYDLSGKEILSVPLRFQCYEILSTEERDISENRISHNINFSILSDKLYLPYESKIVVYDLKTGASIKTISLPGWEVFSGKAFETESGQLLFYTLKGIVGMNAEDQVTFHYSSKFHPVFIDSSFRLFYYYAIVESADSGKKIEFKKKYESGVSLLQQLSSKPVEYPRGIYLPFSLDGSYLLDSQLKIIKEFPFSTTDTIGPHAFGLEKNPVLVTEDRIIITDDYSGIYMIDFLGNLILEKQIDSEVLSLFTIDGKHPIIVLNKYDDYTDDDQVAVFLFSPKGDVMAEKILPALPGFSVSFDGISIFVKGNQVFSIDLFGAENK
ncbi:hypothetical protein EHQ68_15595 [Leptospira congkakensis]|uniref:ERV/ALR sulfhydryl oxidase domain-containing protein n=1 Tax=Leptospira congkakensis TaxID=2484932 RepID=A0A4Z1AAS0_9LEPT|nr:hypothetical protein EHQ68_15595 [Leptospira congkakensis]TGL94275.1 hypothetical protein EHQ69_04435 [Leptospira congkakensis]TGL95081.1 hypothetical protein EHQ70_16360 [Leptospira congkakensis]